MKKIMKKSLQKTGIGLIIMAIVFMSFPMTMTTAAQLSSASDTLSRVAVSGTGSATAGYTQSATASTEGFIFITTATGNDTICLDLDGSSSGVNNTAACAGTQDAKADLITHGGLIAETVYTGDDVAAAIKMAIEAQDGNADSYTVTYDEDANKFTIQGDGGNAQNISLNWLTYTGTDDAAATLGYSELANNADIRTTAATSGTAVSFIVLNDVNDKFTIQIDGEDGAATIDITDIAVAPYVEGADETSGLVAALADAIESDTNFADADVTVTYASNKFRITSGTTGGNSTIKVVEDGADDFLKTVKLTGDTPINGKESSGIVSANHTIAFTATTAVAAGEEIVITFPAEFTLPANLDYQDMDLKINSVETALAAAAVTTTWGVDVTGQVITFTSADGTITAGHAVEIEIGRNAEHGVVGVEQISNPTTIGLYQINAETKTAAGAAVIDDAYIGVYIISNDQVVVTATVDPLLSFSVYGGNNIDFGTLQPNAYHKLGGAQSAYGHMDFAGITPSGTHDTETITVHSIIYELSDDGVIAATSHAKVDIVDNENNYLTAIQVASNLYQAINNYDGDLVRANVDPGDTDKVWIIATQIGTAGNAYTLADTVTGASVSGADFTDGVDGYNQKHTAITYAGGGDVGNGQTGTNLVISTNSAHGYIITIENTDTGAEADGFTNGTNDINAWTTGTYGYGILASAQSARYGDGTSGIIASAFQGDGADDLPEEMSTTAVTLATYTGTTAGDNIAVEYNVRIGPDQAAGNYSDTVTYIATSTF